MSTDRAAESSPTWDEESARGDDQVAILAMKEYGFSDQLQSRLINLSENATYLVEDLGTGRNGILRVHREDYHALESIHSELDWLTALREQSVVSTPVVIPALDGRRVVTTTVKGVPRNAVLFEVVSGLEPDEIAVDLTNFHTLGQITARMHQHSQSWTRPEGFTRFAWDWEHSLGANRRWGRWQDGIGVGPDESQILGSAADLIIPRRRGDEPYGNAWK